ncbi:hypothetical protein CRUP_019093 [Coryphaenoides rupestris]|nr:hypothetical protein CRUP_019093 [Coryphaenoides rupestris]
MDIMDSMDTNNQSVQVSAPRGCPAAPPRAPQLLGIGVDNLVSLLVFGVVFVLGVLGNSAVIITVLARRHTSSTSITSITCTSCTTCTTFSTCTSTDVFILNLSVADLSYLLCCVPFQSTVYMLPTWVLGAFLCKLVHYLFTVSMLVSVFTLSAMSVERYVAVVRAATPRRSASSRAVRRAALAVLVIWTLSLGMALPVARYQRIVESGAGAEDNNNNNNNNINNNNTTNNNINNTPPPHNNSSISSTSSTSTSTSTGTSTFCWDVWPEPHKKVYVVCTFVFGYVLPLALISACYAKVSFNHLHKKLTNVSKKSENSKKKTAQTVLVVVVVFGLSWLPHHVLHLWVEFGTFPLNQASFYFRMAAHCLAYSNSSVNPIIYAFLSEKFRRSYRQVFRCPCRCLCRRPGPRRASAAAAAATAATGAREPPLTEKS